MGLSSDIDAFELRSPRRRRAGARCCPDPGQLFVDGCGQSLDAPEPLEPSAVDEQGGCPGDASASALLDSYVAARRATKITPLAALSYE